MAVRINLREGEVIGFAVFTFFYLILIFLGLLIGSSSII